MAAMHRDGSIRKNELICQMDFLIIGDRDQEASSFFGKCRYRMKDKRNIYREVGNCNGESYNTEHGKRPKSVQKYSGTGIEKSEHVSPRTQEMVCRYAAKVGYLEESVKQEEKTEEKKPFIIS